MYRLLALRVDLYRHQADRVVALAHNHDQHQVKEPMIHDQRAVTWARDHIFERSVALRVR